jgi:thioesterase domain-containing protein/acyl carrier protein
MPFPPELAVFDITIVDENGTVLIEIEEFAVKRLKDQQARIVQQTAASGPRAVQDERPASSAAERPRIATPDGIQALRQLLESQANPVIFVSPSDPRSSADARIVPVAVSRRTLVPDNTVGALQKMWQHVLGIDLVDPDADFFDVGGHSLAALRLFNEINEHFELQLGLSTIFEARTIRALASLIDGMRSDAERPRSAGSASLVPIRPNGSEFPLFFVHGVGGNVLNYQEVVQNLGADQPVYGFQSAGLGGSAPDKSVEQMAARYIPEMRLVQPEGPYFICGQSFGGLVAYEMGRQLEAQGQPVGFVGLIDTFQNGLPEEAALSRLWVKARSAGSRIGFHARRLMLGPDRITYLKATAKTGKRRISTLRYRRQSRRFERRGQDLPATLQDVRHANWLAARSYVPGIFNGTVVLFRCKIRSAADHTDYSMGWRHLVRGSLHIFEVPGDHLSMMTRPGAGILAQELTACMAELFAKSDAATNAENPSILEPSGGKL